MTKHSPTKPPADRASAPGPIRPPAVELGPTVDGSVAGGILAMVERGARLRPELAREPGVVRLRSREGWPSVLIELGDPVRISDDETRQADVEITASLPDLIHLLSTPLAAGFPNPARRDGRAALGRLYRGDVELTGLKAVGRRVLRLLSLT